jgi:hypothetical protein
MTATIRTTPPAPTTGPLTRRRAAIATVCAVAGGVLLAVVWSFEFVDSTIGDSVANGILGYDAKSTAIAGAATGAVFGLVSGLAGTFTACNIAVFGALPEVTGQGSAQRGSRLRAALVPLGWLSLGVVSVSAVYGAIAVLVGPSLPQLSTGTVGDGLPVRLVQASVTFGLIGVALGYLGLVSLGYLRDPFAAHPRARLVVLGVLIGGFLVGRPYPLFGKLLAYAVDQRNPLYGALTFVLQSIGNILVMAVLALLFALVLRGSLGRWMARPGNAALTGGVALLLLATFLVVYWDVRVPAIFGYGWFPTMPWNA